MFHAPRWRWVDAVASRRRTSPHCPHETLTIWGRDDQVSPLSASLKFSRLISRAQLHDFGCCGHSTSIEHSARFACLVSDPLAEAQPSQPRRWTDPCTLQSPMSI